MAVVENRIFVNGVPFTASRDDLRVYFEQFGATTDVYMPLVHGSTQHKGIGFVTYAVNESVNVCMAQPGHAIHGQPVTVELCMSKDKGGGKGKGGDKGPGSGFPGTVNNGDRLFITKIPPDATKDEVEALFSRFGQWTDVFLPNGNFPAGHKGICFISYTDATAANLAISCGPHELRGQELVVEIATPRGEGGKGGGKVDFNSAQQPVQYVQVQQPQLQFVQQQPQYVQPQQVYGGLAPQQMHTPVVVPAPNWQQGYPPTQLSQPQPYVVQHVAAPVQQVVAPTVGLKPGRLFLTKVGAEVSKEDLQGYFQQWGELQDVYVPPGKSIAFVSFSDANVTSQIVGVPEHEIKPGCVVRVDLAYDRPPLEAKGKGKFRFSPYN